MVRHTAWRWLWRLTCNCKIGSGKGLGGSSVAFTSAKGAVAAVGPERCCDAAVSTGGVEKEAEAGIGSDVERSQPRGSLGVW